MISPAMKLRQLLLRERELAKDAKTGELEELQALKLQALAELPADDPERASLAELAQSNLALLRHLQRCYEAALGVAPITYGAAGRTVSAASRRHRGSL